MPTKVPFRPQISEYDCVPTAFLNAISYLFDRKDIPPELIQRTYMYCLDSFSGRGDRGHGTSDLAVELLSSWLSDFRHPRFAVEVDYLEGESVHLREGNKITRRLKQGGVALISVTYRRDERHAIVALRADSKGLQFHDPYPKTQRSSKPGNYEFLGSQGQDPNLWVSRDWLDTNSDKKPFRFGLVADRECLLILRAKSHPTKRRRSE